jgi:hypothetical protein
VVVTEGVFAPPQVKTGQKFQLSFTLRETAGASTQFEEIALAIVRTDGSHVYDVVKKTNVLVGPFQTWHLSDTTAIYTTNPPGTYMAVARGRSPGGSWYNFPSQGGTNPRAFNVVTQGTFAAIIPAVIVSPFTVEQGQRPQITATIRNTATSDTQWGGYATFWVKSTIRKDGAVIKQERWLESFAPSETRTGFNVTPDYTTTIPGAYEVTYQVFSGDDVHHYATRQVRFMVAQSNPVSASCDIPPEPNHRQSYTSFWRAPYGFAGATPWLNVLHDTRQAGSSTVEIDHILLWARMDGVPQVVSANYYTDGRYGGELRARSPWYGGSHESLPGQVVNGVLVLQPGTRPDRVWHPYLESWPDLRVDISRADSVWIEARVRIQGPALVQAGLDYWQSVGYAGNRNVEAAVTDWMCARNEWRTLTLGRGTEVSGAIQLATSPAGSAYQVGKPVTATFTLRNSDNEGVSLSEVGIETRLIVSGNGYCDPSIDQWLAAFPWKTGLTLAPGETTQHTGTWTPDRPGTYCLTVVEKRAGVSTYQKTYLHNTRQLITVQ